MGVIATGFERLGTQSLWSSADEYKGPAEDFSKAVA
jgi:hypothetical protein